MSEHEDDKLIESEEVDFVILWVDGDDPEHLRKRLYYLNSFELESQENAEQSTDDRRFVQHDELKYCLRSIKLYASWYRKIYLVTDGQTPSFLNNDLLHLDRIFIVDHKEIFNGKEEYLPTFNSRAIASRLHHIPDLSTNYIVANDDVILGSSVSKEFFFEKGKPIIYSDWLSINSDQKLTLWKTGIIKAAAMIGFEKERFLVPSHGFLAFNKKYMFDLESEFETEFKNNLSRRFRHESQFVLESLHEHYCVLHGKGVLRNTEPMVHFSFELCRQGSKEKVIFLLGLISKGKRKMFCINEYFSLVSRFPEVKDILNYICYLSLESEY